MLVFYISATTIRSFASLPTPPSEDIADSSHDWIDIGSSMTTRVITIVCVALGALILVGTAAGIIKAFHTAQERQDLSHFFRMLGAGLVAAVVGVALVYAGWNVVQTG